MSKVWTESKLGEEARKAIKKGMDAVYSPVSATMGASGRNAAYLDVGGVTVTNDGISIARRINPKDDFERLGADLIKQAAEETNKEAGDGTTTSIVLAHALVEAGLKDSRSPMVIRKELEKAKNEVVKRIKSSSKEVKTDKELLNVAKISVEDDKLAKIVADTVKNAGEFGTVIVEEGTGYSIEQDSVNGYFWDRGYFSRYFSNNEKGESVLEDVSVIVTDRYMNRNLELMGVLNDIHEKGAKSVLIIADKMEGELLQTLITNHLQGRLKVCAVVRPPSDEELEDIASITGATAITKDKGIRKITSEHVGVAKKVISTKDRVVLVTDESIPARQMRVETLRKSLKSEKEDELKKDISERLAKLTDGIIVLRVGAKTESERKYLSLKVEDAVNSVLSAKEEGIVKGGGVALFEISQHIGDPIMKEALKKPFETILRNAGIEAGKELEENDGYNVLTGEVVNDMFKEGIIDPAKVERCSVENAVSLASTVITLDSVIVRKERLDEKESDF